MKEHTTETKLYSLVKPKEIAGYYYFGKPSDTYSFCISIWNKPKRVHRFFMRILLGLYWKDANPIENGII
jgi:hypothetical protein